MGAKKQMKRLSRMKTSVTAKLLAAAGRMMDEFDEAFRES